MDRLSFIKDKKHWKYVFPFAHLQIPEADFRRISEAMFNLNQERKTA